MRDFENLMGSHHLNRSFRAGFRPSASRFACLFFAGLLLVSASAHAQSSAEAPAPRPKITVIGASVSAGFVDGALTGGSPENDSFALPTVLKKMWPDMVRPVVVRHRADKFMFQTPVRTGQNQMRRVLRDDPNVLVAVDFAFWFAYGHQEDSGARLARLEQCLELLDAWQKPMLLGDIPDMTGASPRLLRPAQIPDAETQAALNKRLRGWATTRPHVTVVPLSSWVRELKVEGFAFVGQNGESLRAPAGSLLQSDSLHVTRLGMVILASRLAEVLQAAMPKSPFDVPHASCGALSDALGVADDYATLLASIASNAGSPAPPVEALEPQSSDAGSGK